MFIFNKMMGGWKQKSGWIQILPDSRVPFTLPFLSQLSVCLIVSRVRAYLTTDQHSYGYVPLGFSILQLTIPIPIARCRVSKDHSRLPCHKIII
jgi:hypothetical protein